MKPIYLPPTLPHHHTKLITQDLLALDWETKRTARHEYFMSDDVGRPYTYGRQDEMPCDRCGGCGATTEDTHSRVCCGRCGGTGKTGQLYLSKPFTRYVHALRVIAGQQALGFMRDADPSLAKGAQLFNGCFLNKYDNQHQHLGWHADDFVGMDADAPIAVMSFGAEREIWVKKQKEKCANCAPGRPGIDKKVIDMPSGEVARDGEPVCESCKGAGVLNIKGAVPPEDRYLLARGSIFIMPPGFQEVMYHRIPKHPEPCGWRISLTFRKFNNQTHALTDPS